MKKKVAGKKLSRSRTARVALFRSLTQELVEHGKITTTFAKPKAVQGYIEKLTKSSKDASLAARRRVLGKLGGREKTTRSLIELASSFSRNSGFTRIIPLPARKGDNAALATIEWVEVPVKGKEEKENKKETKKKLVKSKVKEEKKIKK